VREARKLLFLFSEAFATGGLQRFNRTLLAASENLNAQFDVYSLNDADVPRTAPNISVTGFGQAKSRFARAAFRAVRSGDYAAVIIGHVNFVELTVVALRSRLFRRPAALLITHGIDVWTGIQGMRRIAMRGVDRILCVSHYTKAMIQRQAPELPMERFTIFPNALHASWTIEQPHSERLAPPTARHSALPERFLLSVARLSRFDRAKGIISVIEAVAMLADPTVHYVIAGDGDDRPFLELVAARLGVAERVHFLGAVSDEELFNLYRRCQAFVLPSGQEGFGIVFLEAMYFGAPVIAAAEKGAVDVVQHEQTGLLVPFGDIVKLKAAIDRTLGDGALRERLRAGASASVTNGGPFTFSTFTNSWSNIVHRHVAG
jgi:phosphatidylinositol alpha-1,6-mannosyltransferase